MFYLCKELCNTESLIFLRVWPSKLWVDKILQPLKQCLLSLDANTNKRHVTHRTSISVATAPGERASFVW